MNNTLIKGLGLLEVLAHSERPLGVTELATRVGIGKSNVHRLLQALVELGYVRRDADNGAYAASIRLWELGSAVLANLDLKRAAQGWMDWLLDRTRETVHLSVLDGDEVVYVHKLDSPEPVRAYTQIGGRAPAHCVATGKALLAWTGEAHLDSMARRLRAHSPRWSACASRGTRSTAASGARASAASRRRCATRAGASSPRSACRGRSSGCGRRASRRCRST
jgi:DNA-binding IclR family transcriptional regulator